MNIPQEFITRLADMGGRLPDGTPKMRIVFAPETRRAHGIAQGHYKYVNPETGKVMPFYVLEQHYPPSMLGPRENWPESMGIYPGDCAEDCCNHGYWGFRSALTTNGSFQELNSHVMDMIEQRQYQDLAFSMLDEISRQEHINKLMAERDKNAAEVAARESTAIGDDYFLHKEKEDNADNRVFSIAGLEGKGAKMPIR